MSENPALFGGRFDAPPTLSIPCVPVPAPAPYPADFAPPPLSFVEDRPLSPTACLIVAIERSFAMYKQHGARSTKKLEPLHKYVAGVLRSIWGAAFHVHCMGAGAGEMTVAGKYYPKDIDITVTRDSFPVFCFGVKFVTSNYKQNANNYFENMMGETANIQAVGNLPYAHLIILRHKTPYYKKNNFLAPDKIETINDKDIQKYANLMRDTRQAHRPGCLGIQLIDLDETSGHVSPTDVAHAFSPPIARILLGQMSICGLFEGIKSYKELYNSDKQWEV